jgi:hypothetical protein
MEQLESGIMKAETEASALEEALILKPEPEGFKKLGVLKKKIDDDFEELARITVDHDKLFAGFEKRLNEIDSL